jgi:hypothetical protein
VPIIRRKFLYICDTGICHSVCVATGLLVGLKLITQFQSNQQTSRHHTEWQIQVSHRYSNFLLMMGTWMSETCREEKQINILNGIVNLVWLICEIIGILSCRCRHFIPPKHWNPPTSVQYGILTLTTAMWHRNGSAFIPFLSCLFSFLSSLALWCSPLFPHSLDSRFVHLYFRPRRLSRL